MWRRKISGRASRSESQIWILRGAQFGYYAGWKGGHESRRNPRVNHSGSGIRTLGPSSRKTDAPNVEEGCPGKRRPLTGTEGSNLSSSSGESGAKSGFRGPFAKLRASRLKLMAAAVKNNRTRAA